ncbi:2-keto-4-pentenoate hydratase [Lysinibacillus yapensis]|uniref:2-keto-4-pentenoate hydratase n=1 Tax=Ureibacillus yapensis TaxID=2304605 RepID=A0A396SEA8_9BACL|nr:2-keto-4-pentenoate hydratase [Lysinibacillus yapensis]RHW38316.1 2-keto-4-pentenoate hydratase [Lysinibacillus yapensis]
MELLEYVEKLQGAIVNKKPIPYFKNTISSEPLTEQLGYKVQDLFIQKQIEALNSGLKGYKISMTNEQMQMFLNTNAPAYGTFLDSNIVTEQLSLKELFYPLIEMELVFEFTEDLSMGAKENEILEKAMVAPGLEIPDSRYDKWFPPEKGTLLGDVIADNTATGVLVLGEYQHIPTNLKWDSIHADLFLNNIKITEGDSSAVLGNPICAVEWLTSKLASEGKTIQKGMVVSSGTFINPLKLEKGLYEAEFDYFGKVSIQIVE